MRKRISHNLTVLSIVMILGLLFNPSLRGAENSLENTTSQGLSVETQVTPLMTSLIDSNLLHLIQEENLPKNKFNLAYQKTRLNPNLYRSTKKPTGLNSLENLLYTGSLISFVALNAADYYSTVKGLKYEGVEEANLLMKPFTKNRVLFAAVKLGLTACNVHFMRKLHKKNKGLAWTFSLLANFAVSYVVVNNMQIIGQAKSR